MTMPTPTINEQAQAMAAGAAANLPADVVAAFTADQTALEARGVPQNVAAPGSAMPDGDLLVDRGCAHRHQCLHSQDWIDPSRKL